MFPTEGFKFGIWLLFVGIGIQAKVVTIPLTNDNDVIYRGKVHVGEPAQTFDAVFYTGCDITRFPARGCKASGRFPNACDDKNTYNPKASKTVRRHPDTSTFDVEGVQYTHFGARGRQFHETLSFGTPKTKNFVKVKKSTVGASDKVWAFDHPVVCLALGQYDNRNSTFDDLVGAGVLSQNWITIMHRKCDRGFCENGGAVTLGDLDSENCESKIDWVTAGKETYKWAFAMEMVSFNGTQFTDFLEGSVNTGNSYIQVPTVYMQTLKSAFNLRKHGFYYTTACDSKLEFVFVVNGHQIVVNEKHLILNQQIGDECVVAVTESNDRDQMFILGSPFFRATCVVHDIGEPQRVGFAAIKSM